MMINVGIRIGGLSIRTTAFSPANLSGLSLWLKGDAGITLSGSNVTAWADQSGNANNATATDTPTLTTIGGKTFVNFAGGYFTGDELLTQPQATIMCVARYISATGIGMMFQQYLSDNNLAFYRGFDNTDAFRFFNGIDVSSNSDASNNQTYLFGATVNATACNLFLNGISDASGDCGENTTEGNYYLGRWAGGEATTTPLRMAEIVVYDRVLTTPEREQVEAYLNAKYAIY